MLRVCNRNFLLLTMALCLLATPYKSLSAAKPDPRVVSTGADGKLIYKADARGDRVPDFSHTGYMGGGVAIPDVPIRVVVSPAEGDATDRLQAAIDFVARLPADPSGFRGTVLVTKGRYSIASHLSVHTGGIVLRGQGDGADGTVLVAAGHERRPLIQISGRRDLQERQARKLSDRYVPVGAMKLRVDSTDNLKVGDPVLITRPSTAEWINAIGMHQFPGRPGGDFRFSWVPGKMNVVWHRIITAIDDGVVTLDAPLTTSIDETLGGGTLTAYTWPGRISQVGVENLRCESDYDRGQPGDEQHAWMAITVDAVRDGWIRRVTAAHFVSSAVSVWETSSRITVADCRSLAPISEMGGYRRYTFHTAGQQTLFLRCRAEQGRRDFTTGYLAAGPNAFVHCSAIDASDFSGPTESWSSGVLFDNVHSDHSLRLDNREIWDQGVGWAAANCMLWNCTAPVVVSRQPPGAHNWVMGCWGQQVGDGHWGSVNEFENIDSIYEQQLRDRMGPEAVASAIDQRPITVQQGQAKGVADVAVQRDPKAQDAAATPRRLDIRNGWLTIGDRLLIGGRVDQTWWRGHIIPSRAGEYGPHLTRFVPGRTGPGLTEDLNALAEQMVSSGRPLLSHHWGLWYDQRRQDHQTVRRIDGDAWPPFYEQPWARSGVGRAWDGLSKYDLTRFNPWYFDRLAQFAAICDRRGLVLLNQMYFQHNLLEAGAHWVDAPWRSANALQDLGFAEPPPFENRKRIFMADTFYDVSHPSRREFHRNYIRKSLENLSGCSNVVHAIGEEFTGPLSFVQFWIDTIAEWERDSGKKALVALSCTKDVQDAILEDPSRAKVISIIEMKYWWPTDGGKLFDPKGGQSLAPRQQLREWKGPKSRSDADIARMVGDYRRRFPDKAFLCSVDKADAWALLASGSSVPALPATLDSRLLTALSKFDPIHLDTLTARQYALRNGDGNYIVYSMDTPTIRLDLSAVREPLNVRWIDPSTGRATDAGVVAGGGMRELVNPAGGRSVLWLSRS